MTIHGRVEWLNVQANGLKGSTRCQRLLFEVSWRGWVNVCRLVVFRVLQLDLGKRACQLRLETNNYVRDSVIKGKGAREATEGCHNLLVHYRNKFQSHSMNTRCVFNILLSGWAQSEWNACDLPQCREVALQRFLQQLIEKDITFVRV